MNHIYTIMYAAFFCVCFGCAGTAALAPQAVQLNNAGVQSLGNGDLETAHAQLSAALEYHPRFVDAVVNLALVHMQRGNLKLAEKQLRKAIGLNRHIAQPHHGLGLIYERKHDPSKAQMHYRRALMVDPGFAPSRANLARIYFDSGRCDEAREQFVRLTQTSPDKAAGYSGLADCLYRLGRPEQAKQVIVKAISRLGNDHHGLRIHHARLLMQNGQNDQARALLYSIAATDTPPARDAWAWIGVSYLSEGKSAEAIACAEKAFRFDRDHPLAAYLTAMAMFEQNHPQARAKLTRALELNPGNSVIASALATLTR